MPTMQETN